MTKASENTNSKMEQSYKIYTAHTNIPLSSRNDCGINYSIKLYQEGIISSIDIKILLDYDKDYPLRLFQKCELYYGGELIARNNYLYSMPTVEKDVYTINDLFPGYEFRLDTTNKLLELILQRNTITAKPNNIKITYLLSNNTIPSEKPMMKYDSLISFCQKCKRCKNYQTSVYLEHEPYYFDRYYYYGENYDNDNYSNKPVKRLNGDFTTYTLNDERMKKLNELHKGLNRFTFKPEYEDLNEPVYCIINYSYLA